MEREVEWIRDDAALARFVEGVGVGPLAMDTEGDSLHHYPEKLCLIQFSVDGRDYLVDPLAQLDLSLLGPLLADPGVRKVLHGADYDLRMLDRDLGLGIRGIFDTMIASRLVGERAFGLAALLDKHLEVKLDKAFQRADWSQRPLSPEMVRYAAMDTRHLFELSERISSELERLGRSDWAKEEFLRLEEIRWNATRNPEPFRRVKGSPALTPRELAVLAALHGLREELAVRRDRPPFRVMRDDCLMQLVKLLPQAQQELSQVSGLPRSFGSGRRADLLLAAIREGMELPEAELPVRKRKRRPPRDAERDRRVRKLCLLRDSVAEGLDLEPSLVASRGLLEAVLEAVDSGEPPESVPALRRWQLELLQPALEGIRQP